MTQHSHSHSHPSPHSALDHFAAHNNKFIWGIVLNTLFIIIGIFFGIKANSVGLIADAAHNIGDVFGLLVAWFGYWLSFKKAPERFTYGFKKATVIASFINAIILFMAVGGIIWEAIGRLSHPPSLTSETIIWVGFVGVLTNGITAFLFSHNRQWDINIRAAFLHMAMDMAVSVGVIVAGTIMFWKSWLWVDPVISLIIAVAILLGSWKLIRESLDLLLLAVPSSIDLAALKKGIEKFPGVKSYHDLHIWPMSTTEVALSAHVVVSSNYFTDTFSKQITEKIEHDFHICHVTLQLEQDGYLGRCKTQCV